MTKLMKRSKSARRQSVNSLQANFNLPPQATTTTKRPEKISDKQVNSVQSDIIDSQKRVISCLLESELVAANTGIALKQQGETLAKTKQLTHKISLSLHKSDRDIRAIKSWAGAIFNKFVKPGAGGRLQAANREQSKNNKNERLLCEYESEIAKAYAHADLSQELIESQHDKHPREEGRGGKKVQKEDEITENFNHIASSLNRLKTMSLEMGYEMGMHNELIGDLGSEVKRQDDRTEQITRVLRSYDFYD